MARLTPSAGAVPLVTGIAVATALSGAAVFTVFRSGCENPGRYQPHDGVVELTGGCIKADDLPVTPQQRERLTPKPDDHPADPSTKP
jgi:hypothetical protein